MKDNFVHEFHHLLRRQRRYAALTDFCGAWCF
jgi:hypothetical protein